MRSTLISYLISVATFEDLYNVTDRYEDLIGIARRCIKRAKRLPNLDSEVHRANSLIVTLKPNSPGKK